MLEGQDGLNWERWQNIARTVEDSGYVGLYRSDHFTNPQGPPRDSLECWTSLTWLASHTSRLEFGPLVSPVSFRHPSMLVRMAAAVDDLSAGRLQLGIGAGWQEREHASYGFHLGTVPERSGRLREAMHIVTHLLRDDAPLTFDGKFYQLHEAVLLARPKRPGGPRVVVGGNGKLLTLALAARFADEWNATFRTTEQFQELSAHLDTLLDAAGRARSAVRRTMMTRLDYSDLGKVQHQLTGFAEAGVQRIMLNWSDFDDLAGIESLARAVC